MGLEVLDATTTAPAVTVKDIQGYKGDKINLTAKLIDNGNGTPISSKTIIFKVNGVVVGTAKTNDSGTAILPYTVTQNSGSYNILALFNQETNYLPCNGTSVLTILKTPTSTTVNSVSGYVGDTVKLVAKIINTHNKSAVQNKIVKFYVSNVYVGSATTNSSGVATLKYKITKTSGNYTIRGETASDAQFVASKSNNNLTVKRCLTTISTVNLTAKIGTTVNLQAVLKDSHRNVVLSGKTVKFYLNGKYIGSATTNKSGIAKLKYKLGTKTGSKTLKVYYASDKSFVGSSSSKTIKVTK